jgi:hypothetical protein
MTTSSSPRVSLAPLVDDQSHFLLPIHSPQPVPVEIIVTPPPATQPAACAAARIAAILNDGVPPVLGYSSGPWIRATLRRLQDLLASPPVIINLSGIIARPRRAAVEEWEMPIGSDLPALVPASTRRLKCAKILDGGVK